MTGELFLGGVKIFGDTGALLYFSSHLVPPWDAITRLLEFRDEISKIYDKRKVPTFSTRLYRVGIFSLTLNREINGQ